MDQATGDHDDDDDDNDDADDQTIAARAETRVRMRVPGGVRGVRGDEGRHVPAPPRQPPRVQTHSSPVLQSGEARRSG